MKDKVYFVISSFLFWIYAPLTVCFLSPYVFIYNRMLPWSGGASPKFVVLDAYRFREDYWALKRSTKIVFLKIPPYFLGVINSIVNRRSPIEELRINFTAVFWGFFLSTLRARGLIVAAPYYERNRLVELASSRGGFVVACLFREGVGRDLEYMKWAYEQFFDKRDFFGSIIMFGSFSAQQVFERIRYSPNVKKVVTGVPRLDDFYSKSRECRVWPRKTCLFFSFLPKSFKSGKFFSCQSEFYSLFSSSHAAIARLAIAYPHENFVIKVKWFNKTYLEFICKVVFESTGRKLADIGNLNIVDGHGAQELIGVSSFVVGFASTALFESALSGLPAIVLSYEIPDGIPKPYAAYPESFYFANSELELIGLCQDALHGDLSPRKIHPELIREAVGFFDGLSASRVENALLEL